MSPRFLCSLPRHPYNRSFLSCCQHKHRCFSQLLCFFVSPPLCMIFMFLFTFYFFFPALVFHFFTLSPSFFFVFFHFSGNPSCTSPFQVQPCAAYFKLEIFNLGSINLQTPLVHPQYLFPQAIRVLRCLCDNDDDPFPQFSLPSVSSNTQRNRSRLDQGGTTHFDSLTSPLTKSPSTF